MQRPSTTTTVSGEDWYGRDLSGEAHEATLFVDVDLMEATGTGATFDGCVFRGVQLNAAVLKECAFTACLFDRCVFFDATFERCKLVGSTFTACTFDLLKVEGGNWSFVNLGRAELGSARFEGVRLREADLSDLRAHGGVLNGCDLSGAALEGADLSAADLRGSDLTSLDPRTANLTGAVVDQGQAIGIAEALGLVVRPD
ncbi:pentapeptide repeat-containing protein [Antribacter gilvus]|uniref:pentapeptide repeat-containing protein n=1 Tax=Antribacter gilvus TaxID=2304675 RepID=UPI000F79660D|nr:pentapeptide repeat-containing protein [Antribacter gilvus]